MATQSHTLLNQSLSQTSMFSPFNPPHQDGGHSPAGSRISEFQSNAFYGKSGTGLGIYYPDSYSRRPKSHVDPAKYNAQVRSLPEDSPDKADFGNGWTSSTSSVLLGVSSRENWFPTPPFDWTNSPMLDFDDLILQYPSPSVCERLGSLYNDFSSGENEVLSEPTAVTPSVYTTVKIHSPNTPDLTTDTLCVDPALLNCDTESLGSPPNYTTGSKIFDAMERVSPPSQNETPCINSPWRTPPTSYPSDPIVVKVEESPCQIQTEHFAQSWSQYEGTSTVLSPLAPAIPKQEDPVPLPLKRSRSTSPTLRLVESNPVTMPHGRLPSDPTDYKKHDIDLGTPLLNAHCGVSLQELISKFTTYTARNPGVEIDKRWLLTFAGKLSVNGDRLSDYRCYVRGCSQRNKRRDHIITHLNSHLDYRPFSCTYCCSRFLRKNECKRHELSHTGLRPHACRICDASFKRKDLLTRHARRFHGGVEGQEDCMSPPKRFKVEF